MIILELPYPPSVNHYWIASGHRRFISPEGKRFRCDVASLAMANGVAKQLTGDVGVLIDVYPPDNRRRDLDNLLKAICDSLEHSWIIKDDRQIADLHIIRKSVMTPGRIIVSIDLLTA